MVRALSPKNPVGRFLVLLKEQVAAEIAQKCATADVAITDVGDVFDVTLQKALAAAK